MLSLRMIMFLLIFTALYSGIQFYLYRKYKNWLMRIQPRRLQSWLMFGKAMLVLGLLAVPLRWLISRFWGYQHLAAQVILYFVGTVAAMLITAFFILLIRDLVGFMTKRVRQTYHWIARPGASRHVPSAVATGDSVDLSRRKFMKLGGGAIIGVSLGAPLLAKMSTDHEYIVKRIPLYFPNLPGELEGFTIAQVSDIHSGVFMTENQIRDIVGEVNRLHPNLIALTGDFVDNNDGEIPSIYRTVGDFRSDYGSFGCLGNHDHFANAAKVNDALRQKGIQMLNNANQTLTIDGAKLSIIGIDDAGRGGYNFARFDKAIEQLPDDSFKIFLAHRPGAFIAAKKLGFDLTLSGHTHGGQIFGKIAGIDINPIRYLHPYVEGHYQDDGKQLYVNVGVGMVGVPIRLIPREITLFSLRHGEQQQFSGITSAT